MELVPVIGIIARLEEFRTNRPRLWRQQPPFVKELLQDFADDVRKLTKERDNARAALDGTIDAYLYACQQRDALLNALKEIQDSPTPWHAKEIAYHAIQKLEEQQKVRAIDEEPEEAQGHFAETGKEAREKLGEFSEDA